MICKCFLSAVLLVVSSHPSFGNVYPIDGFEKSHAGLKGAEEDWVPANWLNQNVNLGQVGGIAVDKNDTIYIFHRGDRKWTDTSFDLNDVFMDQERGAITESTIIMLDKKGQILQKLGDGIFYMPHGITIDNNFNIWVTDVALHQVMKFEPSSSNALLVRGTRFIPGKDSNHFCKPTSVAVLLSGDFFVADGYCNSRIVKFNANGKKILEWGRSTVHPGFRTPGPGEFYIPHALTLTENENLLCVADRENGRVQCFYPQNGTISPIGSNIPSLFTRVFSVAYSSYYGGSFVIVTGPETRDYRGFIVSEKSGEILHKFGSELSAPHDVAVSSDGSAIYVGEITTAGIQAWKFVERVPSKSAPFLPSSGASDSVSVELPHSANNERGLLDGAILISTACLIFSVVLLVSASVYKRSRNRSSKDSASLLPHSDF